MVDIIIDSREKIAPYFVSSFIEDGIVPKIEALPAGDFLIFGKMEDDAILIERKEASDFLASLEDDRLWNQMAKMKETKINDRRLLIEGDPITALSQRYRKKTITPARVYGTYEGIFNWGVKIMYTPDRYQTSAYLRNLCKRVKRPKKEFALRSSIHRTLTMTEKRRYIIEGFPGIGPKTSKEIIKKYKTLSVFFEKIDEIDKLPGLGKITKKEIKDILG